MSYIAAKCSELPVEKCPCSELSLLWLRSCSRGRLGLHTLGAVIRGVTQIYKAKLQKYHGILKCVARRWAFILHF
jgi:hypothetical protein